MTTTTTQLITAATVSDMVSRIGLPRLYDLTIERLTAVMAAPTDEAVEMRERDGIVSRLPRLGLLEWMPAVRHGATISVKLVGYHPHNPATHQLPTILSSLLAFDATTGHLRALVDGTFATAVRTGAASAVASRLLAKPDAKVLGLIGCGAQSVTQLHALSRVFGFERVLISDVDPKAVNSFATRARHQGIVEITDLGTLESTADIICTATSVAPGAGPVLDGRALKSDAHVNSVGSDMPGKTELPPRLLAESFVCPDHLAQARREGECQQLSEARIGPSIVELLREPELARPWRDHRTVYDSTGLAVQDLVMVELFEELAAEYGLGEAVVIEAAEGDPQDPYAFLTDLPAELDWSAAGETDPTARN